MEQKAGEFIDGLGGAANIREIEGCVTRLRATLVDASLVDERRLRQAGMIGRPIIIGKGVQVVVGTYAELIGSEINRQLKRR